MINEISIADVATFDCRPEKLDELAQFNFLFGANGSGKTTISRVIADEDSYPTCTVTWAGENKLQTLVYNRDFVDRNFSQSVELKGVFTLGEENLDTGAKIETAKKELNHLNVNVARLKTTLHGEDGTSGKKGELDDLEDTIKTTCWVQKQKYDPKLQGAFEGYRGSSEKFKNKVIHEFSTNSAELLTLAELEQKAESVFSKAPVVEQPITSLDTTRLLEHESNPILKKKVIGKDDVDIARMIRKLGNSDWIREGRSFYEENEGRCPFCQQITEEKFAKSLNEYFDDSFEADINAIEVLALSYETDAQRLHKQLISMIHRPSKFLNVQKLKVAKELLDSKIRINMQLISNKRKETSRVIELESISSVVETINKLIESASELINNHNDMVDNISLERIHLSEQVWKFVLNELRSDLISYFAKLKGLNKAIENLNERLKSTEDDKRKKELQIQNLEKQSTSVQPTIDSINAILSSIGFQGFSIAREANSTSYRLVRSDGSDARYTLSEGEKTLVTFLYFYHLLKGSDLESGVTNDRVVVVDDPVSSLDSDSLFIVSSLIKGLFEDVRTGRGFIRQVFVLTHNVYFHKEVTFNSKRVRDAMNEETFWVVRKPTHVSKVKKYSSNPIKTSYELLWSEVRDPNRSELTIQNTLRRILESYFKILGGIDPDEIADMFEGKEKIICKSLFSWVNDGSHSAHDDLYLTIDSSSVELYLKVFRAIFDKTKHSAHYEMMMGESQENFV